MDVEGSEQGRPRGDRGGPVHAPVSVDPLPGHQSLVAAGMSSASLPPSPARPQHQHHAFLPKVRV